MYNNLDVPIFESFVKSRKVVYVKWISDDPDYYKPQTDLFDYQKNPIPQTFGKKDKRTTEQVIFEFFNYIT